jgi:ApaG protein
MSSLATTNGITITARSNYLADYSFPSEKKFLYTYQINITNESDLPVHLLSRYWLIIDSYSNQEIVRGEGVVGKQPKLLPGESFKYTSFCPLPTNFGTMEGLMHFIDKEGTKFDAEVSRFYLASTLFEFPKNHFARGEIVQHKLYGYRGVIVDFDMSFTADENWYKTNPARPDKNRPWYHVLVDGTDKVTYVAEQNLDSCETKEPIKHPLIGQFFSAFQTKQYVRNQKSWRDINV